MSSREVVLDGGSPWGFRMHGGVDVHQPLRISRVNPGSKASQKGIREGDFISSINGQSTKSITNTDAHALLKNSGQTLRLGLNEDISGSPKRKLGKNSQDGDSLKRSSITSISSTSTINRVLSSIHNTNNETNTSNNTNDIQQRKGDHQLVSPSLSTSDRQNGLNGSLVADNTYHQRHSRTSVSASNSFTVGTPVEPRGGDKTNAKGVSVRSIVMADTNNEGGQNSSTDGSGGPAGGRRSARNRRRAHNRSRKSSSKNVVTVAESIAETNEHDETLSTTIDICTNTNVVIDNNEISLCTTGSESVSDKILVDTPETMQEHSASKVIDVELVNKQAVNIDSAINKSAEKSFAEQCSKISTKVSSQEVVVEAVKSNSSKFEAEKKPSKSRKRSSKNNTTKAAAVEINKNTENICEEYFKETKVQAESEEGKKENDRQKETENVTDIKNENRKESEIDLSRKLETNTQDLSKICNEIDFIDKRKSTVSCDSVDEEVEKITSAMEYGQSHYSVYMEQCSLFTRIDTEPEASVIQSLSIEEPKIASKQEYENKRESVEDNLSGSEIQNLEENYQETYEKNTTKELEKSVEQTETKTTPVTIVKNTTCDITNSSIRSKHIKESESTKQEESVSKNENKNYIPDLELNFEFDSNEKISTEIKSVTVTENTCINNVKKTVIRESVDGGKCEQKSENFPLLKTDAIFTENSQETHKENTTKELEKSIEQTETKASQVTIVENTGCDVTNNSNRSKQNENIKDNESTKQEESGSKNENKNYAPELELNFEFDSNKTVSSEMECVTVVENTCIKDVKKSAIHESVDGGKSEQKSEDLQIQITDEIKAPSTVNENLVSKELENEEDIEKGISSDSLGADVSGSTEIKNEQIIKETTGSMTLHHNILELTTVTNVESDSEVVLCELNYRVESPPPVVNKNSKSPKSVVPKSRSLDDDENKVEITEIVESTEEPDEEKCLSKHLVENSAIISEADDVKWEEAGVLRIAEKAKPSLSIIGLSLEDDFKRTESFETKGAMSPEDEKNLREFLEGLKLASSPLEASKQLSEKTSKDLLTPENLSVRKAKKRAELELFFQPAFMNPRYLNVIQEEGVEMSSSGRDSKTVSESRSWTDDWDIDDDVFINEDNLNSLKNEPMVFNQKQVKLVNAKMIEIQGEYSKECMWTTHKMEPSSGAEIVYLEDSSCSRTPSDVPEQENASDAEDEASCEDRLCWEKDDDIYENVEYKDGHPLFQEDDKPDVITESCDRISDDLNKKTDNDIDKKQNNIAPPPTPEMSNIGKNDTSEEPLSEDIKSFIKKLLEVLSQTDNSEKVYELLKETPLEKFPDEMKETVRDLLNAHNLDISDQYKTLESSDETINSEIAIGVEVSNNELTEVLKTTNKNIDGAIVELSKHEVTPNIELTENVKPTDNSKFKIVHINESAILKKSDEENQSIDTIENLKNEFMGTLNNENLQNDIDEEFEKLYSNLKCQESVKSSDKNSPINSRPDSSASICSSTSQSTAKFIPSCASLADIAALLHDEPVYENVFSKRSVSKERSVHRQNKVNSLKEATPKSKSETPVYEDIQTSPKSLRELCVQNILSLPYGADILEELATVSETIESLTADVPAVEESTNKTEEILKCKSNDNVYDTVTKSEHYSKLLETKKYDNIHYSTSDETDHQKYIMFNSCKISPASNISHQQHEHYISQYDSDTTVANNCPIDSSPMSMSMRTSPDGWVGIPTQDDPNVLVCLSPSQKTYIDQRQCIDKNEADQLLDMHKKFLERRCYHEEQFVLPVKNILKDKVTLSRSVDTPVWISENVLKTQSMAMKNAASAPDKNTTLKNVAASSSEKVCFPRGEEGRDKAVYDEKECTSSSNRLLAIIRDTSSDDCRKMCTSTEMQQRDFVQHGNTARIVTEPDNGNKVLNYNERIRKLMTNNNNNNDVTNKCLTYDETIRELEKISKTGKNNESGETTSVYNRPKSLTIPRDLNNDYKITDNREKSEDRLKARQLSEWMQLARNRSSVPANFEFKIDGNNSSSVKSVAIDAKRVLTCSGAVKVDDTVQRLFTGDRKRFSLPQDMHERQLQYILEQEREIEREIRELEKEKISSMPDDIRRPVTTGQSTQSSDSSLFQRENKNVYHISKRGDIATIQSDFDLPFAKSKNRTEESNARSKSMSSLQTPVAHGERFRQQMYDEYMHKVAEREERKQHKVIKISSSKPVSTNATSDLHAEIFKQHALKIESEFMNRVKERMDKLGLNFSDDEVEAAKQTESHNESEPVLVIDGSSLKEGKDLPKHLQEFVNFTSSTEITSDQTESVNCSESKLSSNKTEINRVLVNTPNESKRFISPITSSKADACPKEDEEEEVSKVLVHSITPSNVSDCPVKEKLKNAGEATDTSSVVRRLLEMAKASSRDDEERRFRARRTASDELRRVERRNASLLHEIDSSLTLGKGFLLARGIWSPSHKKSSSISEASADKSTGQEVPSSGLPPATSSGGDRESKEKEESPPPPIWTPRSAEPSPQAERKEFRPVRFESPVLGRKHKASSEEAKTPESRDSPAHSVPPPWPPTSIRDHQQSSAAVTVSQSLERRLPTSHSAPAGGTLSSLAATSRLPRAQNPTITLLQKAREGQLPRGASYLEEVRKTARRGNDRPPLLNPHEAVYSVKNEYTSESESEGPKRMVDLGPRKFEGIGPTTKDGMPIVLRSEVKDSNQAKWYKRMYETLHKAKDDSEYVTVRYKQRRAGRYPYTSGSGYLSEPEPNAFGGYDSDTTRQYATLDRRRPVSSSMSPAPVGKENSYISSTMPRNNKHMSASAVKYATDIYKNQPGRIENYMPGHSSISEKEAKEWWDEVMEIFDGQWLDDNSPLPRQYSNLLAEAITRSHLEQQKHVTTNRQYMAHALKESGYESDSTLIFRRRDDASQQLSPQEQKEAYKTIQKGGEVPLHGLRKPAPERPKDESEIEYFPISPTLTRIRIHKHPTPINQILCYPITKVPSPPPSVFSRQHYPHVNRPSRAPSIYATQPSSSSRKVPSPPRRRSSRNNATLKLISTMTITSPTSPRVRKTSSHRHDACYEPSTKRDASTSNVQFLKDRISCKLSSSPFPRKKTSPDSSSKRRVKVTKTISASTPSISSSARLKLTSTVSTLKDGSSTDKVKSRTNVSTGESISMKRSVPQQTSRISSTRYPSEPPGGTIPKNLATKMRAASLERTFGVAKRKVDLSIPSRDYRLVQTPDLVSPTEVQKIVQKHKETSKNTISPSGTTVKKSSSLYSSVRNGARLSPRTKERALDIAVSTTNRGRELLRNSDLKMKGVKVSPISQKRRVPSPILVNTMLRYPILTLPKKSDLDETKKKKSSTAVVIAKPLQKITNIEPKNDNKVNYEKCVKRKKTKKGNGDNGKSEECKKSRKNGKNKEIKNKEKENKLIAKCVGRTAGTEIVKKLKKMESPEETSFRGYGDITVDELNQQKEAIKTGSFYQNLLLRNVPSPTLSTTSGRNTMVLEKAKRFQSFQHKSPSDSLNKIPNVYLSHIKPVTESKFRSLDLQNYYSSSIRSYSPASHRVADKIEHFDSISQIDEKEDDFTFDRFIRDQSPDIYGGRSSSEPPLKLSDNESKEDVVNRHYYDNVSPRGGVSPSPVRSPSRRKIISARMSASKPVETIEGPKPIKVIRARSAGDADAVKREIRRSLLSPTQSFHSTSSLNLSQISDRSEYQAYVTELIRSSRKSEKYKNLKGFYLSLERLGQLAKTTSSTDLRPRRKDEEIIDYDRWKKVRTVERAEAEMKMLFGRLKADEKEKGFVFQPSDVNTVRWRKEKDRGLRIKEKSVEDLKGQFNKIKDEGSDLDLTKRRDLEAKKDVYKPLWRGNSVVDLAHNMVEKRSVSEGRAQSFHNRPSFSRRQNFGFGSRLWSSLSMEQVNALKNQLAEIYSQTGFRKPKTIKEGYVIDVPSEKKRQVSEENKLHVRSTSLISQNDIEKSKQTHNHREPLPRGGSLKADSISSFSRAEPSTSTSLPGTLSESEKKRLSQTLSQEILIRTSQRRARATLPIMLPKETMGAVAAANANIAQTKVEIPSPRTCYSLEMSEDGTAPATKYRDKSSKSDFVLVLTPSDKSADRATVKEVLDGWAQPKATAAQRPSSISETESASSETSTKTVIYRGSNETDVRQKVEFFENQKDTQPTEVVIYKPADDDIIFKLDEELAVKRKEILGEKAIIPVKDGSYHSQSLDRSGKLVPSQSYADLKELFGEQEFMKFATVPISKSTGLSPVLLRKTLSSSPMRISSTGSSIETLHRSRSVSPDPEKYWRAYLALVKHGDVLRLTRRFESLENINRKSNLATSKRYKSDPELTRNFLAREETDIDRTTVKGSEYGDVDWLRKKYETSSRSSRGRSRIRRSVRPVSPIPKIPLRLEDRFMPHINIISKLAALKNKRPSTSAPSRERQQSVKELAAKLGCPTGEVEKLRQKFDSPERKMSILGHMFTSSPNVHELRDIAPYLAGPWVAHQYPRRQDNIRSLSTPETARYINGTYPPRRDHKPRPKSSSPPRPKKPPPSILKSQIRQSDIFANQHFDPSIHRPISRYLPPSPKTDTKSPRSVPHKICWLPSSAVYSYGSRPTVTFKEPELAPIPPPKGRHIIRDYGPESPRRYVENEVTIHYRSPVRQEVKEILSEEELARRQAEAMRRIYQEERRRKYLQELQDMNSRRHTDNFTPSQKSPIPLNRYDDFDEVSMTKQLIRSRDRTPEPRLVARALFNFVGQSSRELTFKKGDIIYVRRQIDKNWYEGEHNAMIGLFPVNYVEIIPYDGFKTVTKKPHEGQARAKFNFIAQTHLELSLAKGETVVLTRRVDDNWFEGRIGNKKGIFPVSYVEVAQYPGEQSEVAKPVASPAAHSMLLNGSSGGKQSMGSHHYQPSFSPSSGSAPGTGTNSLTGSYHHAKPVNVMPVGSTSSLTRSTTPKQPPVDQTLHVDTQSEPIPYRAMYKYRPQNEDELELQEGDTVYVLEKCDDGWYVGSSQRTGAFGTFPGNYVERI